MESGQPRLPRVLAPVATPFLADLEIDTARFLSHCDRLVADGAGLALFGTTSEAASLALAERRRLLEAVLDHGTPPELVMPGTGTCAIPETVALTTEAVRAGCPAVLMLPTFFYKNQTAAGVTACFSEVIERVADERLRIYLYNIPAITGVEISAEILTELSDRYPAVIAGVKDSSGDWPTTRALLNAAVPRGLSVYVGSERYLLATLAAGGRGCISATANIDAAAMVSLASRPDAPDAADAETQQRRLSAMRLAAEEAGPLIAVVKALLAARSGCDGWRRMRPPLQPISDAEVLAAATAVGQARALGP